VKKRKKVRVSYLQVPMTVGDVNRSHRVYTIVCSQVKVPATVGELVKVGELVSFRKLLINRCQAEFEKDSQDEMDSERRQAEINNTNEVSVLYI